MSYPLEAGGFDVTFVDEVDDELKCVVCCLVLRDPIQLMNCGHRFCKSCLDKMQEYAGRLNTNLICPVDREHVDLQKVFADKGISRMVGNLRTRCKNQGCGYEVDLRDLQKHEESCDYETVAHGGARNATSDPHVSLEEILNRLQRCEDDLVSKDKELLQLKYSVKELKDENTAMKQELLDVKKIQQEERLAAASIGLQDKVMHLEKALEHMDTTNRKIEVLETNDVKLKVDDIATRNILKLQEDIDSMINEIVEKLVDPQLTFLRNDIAHIKHEATKIVKETRGTRSHLDKSFNKLATKIELNQITSDSQTALDDLRRHLHNIENVLFAFDDLTPTNDVVLKWVVQEFKRVSEEGGLVYSPVFNVNIKGYMISIYIHFDDSGAHFRLGTKLHGKEGQSTPLPQYSEPYTLRVHGKDGYTKDRVVTSDDISQLRNGFIIKENEKSSVGVDIDQFLCAPYDNYLINDSLMITCTIHM